MASFQKLHQWTVVANANNINLCWPAHLRWKPGPTRLSQLLHKMQKTLPHFLLAHDDLLCIVPSWNWYCLKRWLWLQKCTTSNFSFFKQKSLYWYAPGRFFVNTLLRLILVRRIIPMTMEYLQTHIWRNLKTIQNKCVVSVPFHGSDKSLWVTYSGQVEITVRRWDCYDSW